jgi:hypothetical protein
MLNLDFVRLSIESRLLWKSILISVVNIGISLVVPIVILIQYPLKNELVVILMTFLSCCLYFFFLPNHEKINWFTKITLLAVHAIFMLTLNLMIRVGNFGNEELLICFLFLVIWISKEGTLYKKLVKYKKIKDKRKAMLEDKESKAETVATRVTEIYVEKPHIVYPMFHSSVYDPNENEVEEKQDFEQPKKKQCLQIEEFIQPLQIRIPEQED